MNRSRSTYVKTVAAVSVLTVVVVLSLAKLAAAQSSPPDPSTGLAAMSTPLPPIGDGQPANSSGPSVAQQNDGPDARSATASAPAATLSYYRLLGTAFNPRTSTTTYAYNFNGCIYETGGSDNRFMAPLLIPNGSVIKYLRIYYNDTSAGTDLTAWLTRYQPGVTSEDLTVVNSAGSGGYGTTLSPELTHTVDTDTWAYTIIVAPNANAISNSICGIRVAYYAPSIFGAFLPMIQKN
ncbi:MAG: hypothetical protein MUC51_00225 [Anaerolineae bacterium]|jgi:hypothetical protein|nr:hypothetical protein [Anaerolineae bacterium]